MLRSGNKFIVINRNHHVSMFMFNWASISDNNVQNADDRVHKDIIFDVNFSSESLGVNSVISYSPKVKSLISDAVT